MRTFSYLFSVRPAVVCNFSCDYCYRQDFMHEHQHRFNIESMLWHAEQYPDNIFNFCGYGETMIHPQFSEMIIELSKVTTVNWVTNGTQFNSQFDSILKYAKHENIMDVFISVHAQQIKNISAYSIQLRRVRRELGMRGVKTHITTILTDSNVDAVLYTRRYLPDMIIKHPFDIYSVGGSVITHAYSEATTAKLNASNIVPGTDWIYGDQLHPPFIGKPCMNGSKIFEVMHDGLIYDCSFDSNRVVIGDINVKEPIRSLGCGRLCKSICETCIPTLRNSFGLVR